MSGPARAKLPRTTRNVELKVGSDIAGSAWGVSLSWPKFYDAPNLLSPPLEVLCYLDGNETDLVLLTLGRVYYGWFNRLTVADFSKQAADLVVAGGPTPILVDVTVLPDKESAVWDRAESPRTLTQVQSGQQLESPFGEQLAGLDATGIGRLVGADAAGHALTTQRRGVNVFFSDGGIFTVGGAYFQPLGTGARSGIASGADVYSGVMGVTAFVGGTSPTLSFSFFSSNDLCDTGSYANTPGNASSAGGNAISPAGQQGIPIDWPFVNFQGDIAGSPTSTTVTGVYVYGH